MSFGRILKVQITLLPRYNVDPQPNVWVGKIAHGSYDNWCDGHGLVRDI